VNEPVPALELRGVTAGYGRIQVLHGVDLAVPPGSVVALLGPNGAGKTTTLKVASGQLPATGGCVHIAGRHVNDATWDALARAGVCTIPEGRGIFPNLTVAENLRMVTFCGVRQRDVEDMTFARFPLLRSHRSQLAGTLSGGEQQMLAMARALVTRPGMLLLDEISMGLAPKIVEELYQIVVQIAGDGVAVLLVEQFAAAALAVADRAAVMAQGQVLHAGSPAAIGELLGGAYLGAAS
jgi:branched-chain amino acid transport system ATP-binding protein